MKAFTALVALASAANAHMIMRTPVPAGSPNNSPLDASGSDFPCKTGGGQIDLSNPNKMTVGVPNTLSFTGSAVHGGGSCQISLTKGTTVSKDTKWMVIHSIEGGCPSNAPGNLAADPSGTGASTFQFTVPDHPDLGAGDYTLAWTWNNKIGNREMYMNCAYVQLGAAAKKRYAPAVSRRDQAPLPAMFVANIGNGCTVPDNGNVKYPDPGSSVEVTSGETLTDPVGSCGSSGAQPSGAASESPTAIPTSVFGATVTAPADNTVVPMPGSPSATGGFGGSPQNSYTGGGVFATNGAPGSGQPSAAAGNPVATASPNNGQYTQSAPGVFATGAASQSAPAESTVPTQASSVPSVAPIAPSPSASAAATAPSDPSPSANVSSSPSADCPKSQDGYWSCAADGKSFQRCASGSWSASIEMAAGTSCTPGTSANLIYGSSAKRDLKSHIARRRHNIHSPHFS